MAEEHQYQRERKYFGRIPQGFDDTEIKIIGSHPIVPESKDLYILRNPNKLVLDNIPQLSEHKVSNVDQFKFKPCLGQHRAYSH